MASLFVGGIERLGTSISQPFPGVEVRGATPRCCQRSRLSSPEQEANPFQDQTAVSAATRNQFLAMRPHAWTEGTTPLAYLGLPILNAAELPSGNWGILRFGWRASGMVRHTL